MGVINIPIQNDKNIMGTLNLDNALFVPSLDRRFSLLTPSFKMATTRYILKTIQYIWE